MNSPPPTVEPPHVTPTFEQEGVVVKPLTDELLSSTIVPTVSDPIPPPPPPLPIKSPIKHSRQPVSDEPPLPTRQLPRRAAKDKNWKTRFSGEVQVNKASILRALSNPARKMKILEAVDAEIANFEQGEQVMAPIKFKDIPVHLRSKANLLDLYLFHVEKKNPDGTFLKDKCRAVVLSDRRPKESIGPSTSPTVNPISTMTQLQIAAVNRFVISSYDVRSAFLGTPLKPGVKFYLRVSGFLLTRWLEVYPNRKDMVSDDGNLYLEAHCYWYGIQESSKEFNEKLDRDIKSLGFKASKADPCLYYRLEHDGISILSVHVDDMLLSVPSIKIRIDFEQAMLARYQLTMQHDTINYLGMQIQSSKDGIKISQHGFLDNILQKHKGFGKTFCSPMDVAMFKSKEPKDSNPTDKSTYLSIIMSLMYLARFTRPDILFAVTYLASKVANPTDLDMKKVRRILDYLSYTKGKSILLSSKADLKPKIYVDSSHTTHADAKGHGGFMIMLGSAPIFSKSFKLRLITRSSAESELVALDIATTYATWLQNLLVELRVIKHSDSIIIYEDNEATIGIAHKGPSFSRTKHLLLRESLVKEAILNGIIKVIYKPTHLMIADMLTKPLDPVTLNRLMKLAEIG
jgi:hypothetical protein